MGPASDDIHTVCRGLYAPLVAGFRALGAGREDAEDVAQDALAKLVERWNSRRPDQPLAWCFTVGRNAVVSRARRRSVETRVLRALRGREASVDLDVDVVTNDVVRSAVRRLPRRQREAVIHRFFLGLDVAETARAMRCAPGTVTALTHQALERLRPELTERSVPSSRGAVTP
jgi:RNA polymerase sigma factor (sigma-70 family)